MIDILGEIDKQIFLFLNSCHSHFFDVIMWWLSDKLIWIPLYLLFIYLLIKKYGWESIRILLLLAILIALSDQISWFIKNSVERFRPSHSPEIKEQVHILNGYIGGNYGFVSGHATISFALAYFLYKFLKFNNRILIFSLFLWAALISYSRIYLGVHYPGDVIGGAFLGLILAWIIVRFYKKVVEPFCFSKQC